MLEAAIGPLSRAGAERGERGAGPAPGGAAPGGGADAGVPAVLRRWTPPRTVAPMAPAGSSRGAAREHRPGRPASVYRCRGGAEVHGDRDRCSRRRCCAGSRARPPGAARAGQRGGGPGPGAGGAPVHPGTTAPVVAAGPVLHVPGVHRPRVLGARRTTWCTGPTAAPSDVDNAALLCQRHHTHVHTRRLIAQVRDRPDELGRCVVWDLHRGQPTTGTWKPCARTGQRTTRRLLTRTRLLEIAAALTARPGRPRPAPGRARPRGLGRHDVG